MKPETASKRLPDEHPVNTRRVKYDRIVAVHRREGVTMTSCYVGNSKRDSTHPYCTWFIVVLNKNTVSIAQIAALLVVLFGIVSCQDPANRVKCVDVIEVEWALRMGGPEVDGVMDIVSMDGGSVLLTGYFSDDATFSRRGSGSVDDKLPSGSFAVLIDGEGSPRWSLYTEGSGDAVGHSIELHDDQIYIFGRYWGTATFDPGGDNEATLTNGGSFVAKYDLDGKLIWARRISDSPVESLAEEAISVADDGSFMIAGGYGIEVTFGVGQVNETTLTRYGGFDIFVAKYNSTGDMVWATRAGGPTPTGDWGESDMGTDIQVLPDESSIVTGFFFDSAIFGEGELNETVIYSKSGHDDDIFLAKYNQDGTLAWAKSIGAGVGSFRYFGGFPRIDLSSDGSVFISSSFSGTAVFGDSDPPDVVLTSPGSENAFFANYENDGSFMSATKVGEKTKAGDVSVTDDNAVIITGAYFDDVTFGFGEPNETVLLQDGDYGGDVYVAKYSIDGHFDWALRAVGSALDEGNRISSTDDGGAILAGSFQRELIFCTLSGDNIVLDHDYDVDMFLSKIKF